MSHRMKTSMSEADACEFIIALVYDRCRIRLHNGKEALIRARLGKRIRHYGFSGLGEYCEFLQSPGGEEELPRVVEALTTNFTNFMREPEHFRFMVEKALPSILPPGSKKFRIWSAACSSGEEPYTIAFYLSEYFPSVAGWDWQITASDISNKVLDKAKAGIYGADRLSSVPDEWIRRYFQRGVGEWENYFRVKKSVARSVEFQQINLIEPYSHKQSFEIIFCRNVMIYFDRQTQAQLVHQLCQYLVPGGYLLVGHSESLNGLSVPVRCLRPSIYQRT